MSSKTAAKQKPDPKEQPDIALEKVNLLLEGLKELLMGQREINGHLYVTNDKIIEAIGALDARTANLPGRETGAGKSIATILKEAEDRLEQVGGKVPPGCDKGLGG